MDNTTTDEWKEEFDKKFFKKSRQFLPAEGRRDAWYVVQQNRVKNHISNLLSSQRTKDRAELREKIQTFKLLEVGVNTEGYLSKVRYNQALDRVLELLKD